MLALNRVGGGGHQADANQTKKDFQFTRITSPMPDITKPESSKHMSRGVGYKLWPAGFQEGSKWILAVPAVHHDSCFHA